ncbi:tRNA pseudouridine synthase A [Thalassoglobus neptunius]|uniref:tRNA pseudouridine synthase A n=1 Tax=Thalassoglobus neptunius TaxID=1938619 RepID=A0A5C5WAJ7_9PLAN|nr:tRNA pseudouridine(38-40) synthase TruA [Thalassoglobus neptunius]TWT47089.1 tRNA pseudouridine synthase A [Thalassoglobus neptunius]
MPTIRLRIAYDGTNYSGWQVQPNETTVQGVIETAIHKLTGEAMSVLCAGRTDAGVHALGQVASFRSDFNIPPHRWRPALQSHLPEDVVILESDQVADEFHATFSAVSKRYRYVIHNSVVEHPFWRTFVWRIAQPLDEIAMHEAAQVLVGTHDFRSFESHWPNKATSVRTVHAISLRRHSDWNLWSPTNSNEPEENEKLASEQTGNETAGDFISLEIEADGFLYNMVRTITGTLVNIGRGTWTKENLVDILNAQDRKIAGATAPACGLYLAQVHYPQELTTPTETDPGE